MLPALSIHQSSLNVISELADDPPVDHVVPLWAFKNLQTLECIDIDPRMLMGWDRLAESLRSLTLRKSGIEDLTEVFVDAVVEDQARRQGEAIKPKRRKLIHRNTDSRRPSWRGPPPTAAIQEEPENEAVSEGTQTPPLPPLSGLKWAFLKHLCLADNALTFFPSNIIPHLLSVTYLDLSSNLLVSVPSGLNQMYNLVTLNLSDNMIESVLGIYTMLGQILTLNISRNRIDSLCGLERLVALEKVDVRKNEVWDIGEVGRLATLPNLQGVWIEGNPFTETHPDYRIVCFNQFLKEGKTVTLDGQQASFMERRSLIAPPPTTAPTPSAIKSPPVVPSPPVVAVGSPPEPAAPVNAKVAELAAPATVSVQTPPKKKRPTKRLVDLDGSPEGAEGPGTPTKRSHRRERSEVVTVPRTHSPLRNAFNETSVVVESPTSPRKNSHSRGMTVQEGTGSPPLRSARVRSPTFNPSSSGFATVSGNGTLSKRRTKLSPAMFSPTAEESSTVVDLKDTPPGTPKSGGADAFRAEIEALRASAPDNWLKVLSQKQFTSGSEGGGGSRVGSPGTDAEDGRRRRHLRGVTEY
ncbi:hypothetical protein M408DRAFT_330311 [Serendipita vermifera MAFF 305830]|uniref:Uncharacterized protein n=1 Tax=Serendipita vermifera MAFF 305830 TaxID=933852 RepID=A0A0C3B416_SERVB|nr:hypothetical protein M408DRAFT_330311 [Serendipita vermifera MAFF 305830]